MLPYPNQKSDPSPTLNYFAIRLKRDISTILTLTLTQRFLAHVWLADLHDECVQVCVCMCMCVCCVCVCKCVCVCVCVCVFELVC